MKKLIFLTLIAIILSSTFIFAQVTEDTRYGLLQASKYSKDKMVRTEVRAGVFESIDPTTGEVKINSVKNQGGIKTKADLSPIATPLTIKKPLRNDLARTNLGKKAVAQETQTKITQQQALQRIQKSDLVSGQVVSELPLAVKEQNPMRILFNKVWDFLKG